MGISQRKSSLFTACLIQLDACQQTQSPSELQGLQIQLRASGTSLKVPKGSLRVFLLYFSGIGWRSSSSWIWESSRFERLREDVRKASRIRPAKIREKYVLAQFILDWAKSRGSSTEPIANIPNFHPPRCKSYLQKQGSARVRARACRRTDHASNTWYWAS